MALLYQKRLHPQKIKFTKWHKPVTIIEFEVKPMLKFKSQPKKVSNVGIVLDRSSSMSGLRKETVQSLNTQLKTLREESLKTGIETKVSILTFADTSDAMQITNVPIQNTSDIEEESYLPNGNTALRDAIGQMHTHLSLQDGMKMMIVITDGEENWSRNWTQDQVRILIKNSIATDLWTFAFCMPNGRKQNAIDLGVPVGCVTEWEGTVQGSYARTQSVSRGTQVLYSAYAKGNTSTMDFFSPDLNNLSPSVVNTNLDDLTNNFKALNVPNKEMISTFITRETGKSYRIGSAFYQLTKKEKVQDFKDVLLVEKKSQRIYGGDNARSLLRIPAGGDIVLNPATSNDYEVYVRSASWNRNLMPNTRVLVSKV